jgi:DNA-binding transcriptional LysR family regulator
VRPLVSAFLDDHSAVQTRLILLDRVANLIDEGIDVAVRIGHLPDSGLTAVKCGQVRRVTCATRKYLSRRPPLREPADLMAHDCITFSQAAANDVWTFAPGSKGNAPKRVRVQPRMMVNGAEAAVAAAVEGGGVTRVLSYQVERELQAGRLVRVLDAFEPPPLPVHLVHAETRTANAKTRAFIDLAAPALRKVLARIDAPLAKRR